MFERLIHKLQPIYLTPAPVRGYSGATSSTTSFTVTPTIAPVVGNMIFICTGTGSGASRVITPPAGWTAMPGSSSGGSRGLYGWFRVVETGEPSSYTFTWTTSANMGWGYVEFTNVQPTGRDTLLTATGGGPGTSYSSPSFNVPRAGLAISAFAQDGSSLWTASGGGWGTTTSSSAKLGYKVYGQELASTIDWSGPSSTSFSVFGSFFPCKTLYK